jgi:hypothetical protein
MERRVNVAALATFLPRISPARSTTGCRSMRMATAPSFLFADAGAQLPGKSTARYRHAQTPALLIQWLQMRRRTQQRGQVADQLQDLRIH